MKNIFFVSLLSAVFVMDSCNKDNSSNNNNNSPYYFKCNQNGNYYNYTAALLQYGNNGNYDFGGYEVNYNFNESGGVVITFNDSATAARVTGLLHDSLFFDGSYPSPQVSHSINNMNTVYHSTSTSDHSYYVYINAVNFLYRDTLSNYDIYGLGGTFKTKMQDQNGSPAGDATNGQFYFQASVNHFNH